ncbi:hypothetical protein [Breoghania sp.]|uniref:hypothetical protein n=1 Tax=Breoghania sp. TaxID=2065378 RepID=UPI002AAB57AE|nr:hypothetical protein [Breoghania sp.]
MNSLSRQVAEIVENSNPSSISMNNDKKHSLDQSISDGHLTERQTTTPMQRPLPGRETQ